jgi:hypothetical protein
MTYEIKATFNMKDGTTVKYSHIATSIELTNKGENGAIKYQREGKKRFTWLEFPNEYQMKKYYESVEVIITEATTGRRIYTWYL